MPIGTLGSDGSALGKLARNRTSSWPQGKAEILGVEAAAIGFVKWGYRKAPWNFNAKSY